LHRKDGENPCLTLQLFNALFAGTRYFKIFAQPEIRKNSRLWMGTNHNGGDDMGLQDLIKKDLALAMKAKDDEKKNILRVVMGEFGRQTRKDIPDTEVIQILKKLIKSEKEVLAQTGGPETDRFIEVAENYLPKMATEAEISTWIDQNIDFSQFKNKMQAMRPIMAHFGATADGNLVKQVLLHK
jgi:uncharacterized protein